MMRIENKIKIVGIASDVFQFLADFENLQSVHDAQNSHSVYSQSRIEAIGQYADISFKFLGVSFAGRYTVTGFMPGKHLVFQYTSGLVVYNEEFIVESSEDGKTVLTHVIEGDIAYLFKITSSMFRSYVTDYYAGLMHSIRRRIEMNTLRMSITG